VAKAQLYFVLSVYGERLGPIWDTFTGLLPTEKPLTESARQDWNHLTDFLHHKLLLVDHNRLQAGGRNVQDSYHMRSNPLTPKYVFMDTDIRLDLQAGGHPPGFAGRRRRCCPIFRRALGLWRDGSHLGRGSSARA